MNCAVDALLWTDERLGWEVLLDDAPHESTRVGRDRLERDLPARRLRADERRGQKRPRPQPSVPAEHARLAVFEVGEPHNPQIALRPLHDVRVLAEEGRQLEQAHHRQMPAPPEKRLAGIPT